MKGSSEAKVYVNTAEQAYTRYEYPANGVQSKVYRTLVDTNANGPDGADEVLSESWADGAGREAKRSNRVWDSEEEAWEAWETNYFVFSSVMGRTLTEVGQTGSTGRCRWFAAIPAETGPVNEK